jgi:multidrug efflux pump
VVHNNIIFIDTYKRLRDGGMEMKEALIRTGTQRLRPIFLTAATVVLGLIPMVFMMNIDFMQREITFGAPSMQWWTQLSTTIAGGMTFATFLTLLYTPSMIYFCEKIFAKFKRKKKNKKDEQKS